MATQACQLSKQLSCELADKLIGRNYVEVKEPTLAHSKAQYAPPLIMGVDPGLRGAISVVEIKSQKIIDMIDMPTYKTKSDARKQGYLEHIDAVKLSLALDFYAPLTSIAILEMPGAMPGQGLSSTFRFGQSVGLLNGLLIGKYISVCGVAPAVWKASMGLSYNKEDSIKEAITYFKDYAWLWKLKKHNDRAESALLAIYGMRYLLKA